MEKSRGCLTLIPPLFFSFNSCKVEISWHRRKSLAKCESWKMAQNGWLTWRWNPRSLLSPIYWAKFCDRIGVRVWFLLFIFFVLEMIKIWGYANANANQRTWSLTGSEWTNSLGKLTCKNLTRTANSNQNFWIWGTETFFLYVGLPKSCAIFGLSVEIDRCRLVCCQLCRGKSFCRNNPERSFTFYKPTQLTYALLFSSDKTCSRDNLQSIVFCQSLFTNLRRDRLSPQKTRIGHYFFSGGMIYKNSLNVISQS